jgi:hypothetical protein
MLIVHLCDEESWSVTLRMSSETTHSRLLTSSIDILCIQKQSIHAVSSENAGDSDRCLTTMFFRWLHEFVSILLNYVKFTVSDSELHNIQFRNITINYTHQKAPARLDFFL